MRQVDAPRLVGGLLSSGLHQLARGNWSGALWLAHAIISVAIWGGEPYDEIERLGVALRNAATLELAKSARRARTFPDRFEIRATVEVPMAEARAAARARGKRKRAGEEATAYRIRFMAPRSAGDPKAIVFEAVVVGKRAALKLYTEKRLELDPHYWGSASFGPVTS